MLFETKQRTMTLCLTFAIQMLQKHVFLNCSCFGGSGHAVRGQINPDDRPWRTGPAWPAQTGRAEGAAGALLRLCAQVPDSASEGISLGTSSLQGLHRLALCSSEWTKGLNKTHARARTHT